MPRYFFMTHKFMFVKYSQGCTQCSFSAFIQKSKLSVEGDLIQTQLPALMQGIFLLA